MQSVVSGGMQVLWRSLIAVVILSCSLALNAKATTCVVSGVCQHVRTAQHLKPTNKPTIPGRAYLAKMVGKVRYELKSAAPGKPALIILILQWNRNRVRVSTKEHVMPEHWDKKTYRVADRYIDSDAEYYEVNRVLDELAAIVRKDFNQYRRDHRMSQFNNQRVIELVRTYTDGASSGLDGQPTVLEYYQQFMDDRVNSGHIGINTLRGERSTFRHFEQFNDKQPSPIRFEQVDLGLFEGFRDYFWSLPGEVADSTVHKNLRRFRQVLIHAAVNGIQMKADVSNVKLREHLQVRSSARDNIALYEDDLKVLAELPLMAHPKLRRCRDLFLCGCYTGLRFNRWGEITTDNLVTSGGVKMLELFTKKGQRKSVTIPLHPELEKLFEYYEWSLPLVPGEAVINKALKKIGRLAGFTDTIELARNIKGRSVIKSYKRYELISTHTARRSFATNAHYAGVPLDDIRAMTGQTMDTLLHYIKEDGKRRGKRLGESDWFKSDE